MNEWTAKQSQEEQLRKCVHLRKKEKRKFLIIWSQYINEKGLDLA
jgi:hypothetical protein